MASATVVLTAACGGGGDASGNGGPEGGNSGFTAYTECLRQNGVTITMPSREPGSRPSGMPRPSGSAGPRGGGLPGGGFPGGGLAGGGFGKPAGVDDATWEKAQSACASLRPSGRPGGQGNGGRRQNAAYENCLQENGVTTTDGQPPDTADATVRKAMETCQVLRQAGPSATPSA